MHQRKHEISACITSVGRAVCPEHLVEIEQAYNTAQAQKSSLATELEHRRRLFAEKTEYLRRLRTNKIIAGREVPLLRSELVGLKEKILSLSFETERWGKTCTQQEEKITSLTEKKRALETRVERLEEQRKVVDQEIIQVEAALHSLNEAITKFSQRKDELGVIQDLGQVAGDAPDVTDVADKTPDQLIAALTAMSSEIESARAKTEQYTSRTTSLEASIATQNSELDKARARLDKLKKERALEQQAVDQLAAQSKKLQQDIAALADGYQMYWQIFSQSKDVGDRHQNLVAEVNQANINLKEALLTNNRLELSLRLEDFKLKLLARELENLS